MHPDARLWGLSQKHSRQCSSRKRRQQLRRQLHAKLLHLRPLRRLRIHRRLILRAVQAPSQSAFKLSRRPRGRRDGLGRQNRVAAHPSFGNLPPRTLIQNKATRNAFGAPARPHRTAVSAGSVRPRQSQVRTAAISTTRDSPFRKRQTDHHAQHTGRASFWCLRVRSIPPASRISMSNRASVKQPQRVRLPERCAQKAGCWEGFLQRRCCAQLRCAAAFQLCIL